MSERQYFLMHQDDVVCAVSIDIVSGVILRVSRPKNPELLPLGGSAGADALRRWWLRRAVPMSRDRIRALLSHLGLTSAHEYLVKNLGLSLSDHYWIKPIDTDLCWHEINLFENDFCDIAADDEIEKNHITPSELPLYTPGSSTQGDLLKKWVIINGRRCLIKGNRGANSQNSLNEIVATLLHRKQGTKPYCEYSIYKPAKKDRIYCVCNLFTSATTEFIPAIDLIESKKKSNTVSNYEHLITVCAENGLAEDQMRTFLEYQILSDFVLTNTDRHLNNFGVLRDAKTLQFISPAPIFDTGNSMFWDNPRLPNHSTLEVIPVNSLYETETRLLQLVRNKGLLDLTKLPTKEEVQAIYEQDPMITHLDSILHGYQKKIKLLSSTNIVG